jgi:phage repressor protein C with HTH and peptisase S24 domain
METINKRISHLIVQLKMTPYEFSKKMGNSRPDTLYNLLNNEESQPTPKTLNKIKDNFPDINYSWLLTGEGEMFNDGTKTKVVQLEPQQEPTGYYLPDVYAAAGLDKEMVNDELNRIPVNIPNWEKNTIFINVLGDSMYPEYNSGDIIGIKETEFDYIIFGFAYLVILQNGDVYVKYIKKGIDKDHIILESENEFYEPKEIHLSKVKKVFQIKGVITKKSM